MTKQPLFYVKGRSIFQRSVRKPGGLVTMGFLVCRVSEHVDPVAVCALLNKADPPPEEEPCTTALD